MEPNQIRALILMKGKTMKQLAETIGTTRQCIHSIVHGRTRSTKYRKAISDFVDKPIKELWPDDATYPPANKNNGPAASCAEVPK